MQRSCFDPVSYKEPAPDPERDGEVRPMICGPSQRGSCSPMEGYGWTNDPNASIYVSLPVVA